MRYCLLSLCAHTAIFMGVWVPGTVCACCRVAQPTNYAGVTGLHDEHLRTQGSVSLSWLDSRMEVHYLIHTLTWEKVLMELKNEWKIKVEW